MAPRAAIILGEDDGAAPRYVKVLDGSLVNGVTAGAQVFMKGTALDQAIEEGKIEDVSRPVSRSRNGEVTTFRVHIPEQESRDFSAYIVARQYAARNGGTIEIIKKGPDDA